MFPVLFRWGDAALFTYPVIFSLAFFVGLFVWIRETRPLGIPAEKIVNLSLGVFFSGLLGARLLFLLTQWESFLDGSRSWIALWEGGLVFLGGFIAAVGFLYWALPRARIPRRVAFETLTPAVAWAHAVGRWACFANGCCHGSVCPFPWAVTYTNPLSAARPLGTPLHPSQLYESAGLIVLGWLTHANNQKNPTERRFSSVSIYLAGYGILRFFVEFSRGDSLRGSWMNLSTSQWISLALIFAAVLLDSSGRRDHNRLHESRNRES